MSEEIFYKMKNIAKKTALAAGEHAWIVIFSFLLTVLIFAPGLAFPKAAGSKYQGININHFGNDAHFYLTRGKEVLEGHNLGSPLLREGKDNPDAYLSYSEYILLAPVKLLGLREKIDIAAIYNAYAFAGVFILIILIYFFIFQLSGNKPLSMAGALFAVGGYSIIYFKTLFYHDFNAYARVIYPYFSSLIVFAYLNLLVKSLKSDELRHKIYAGAVFGLMFYVYFYAWSFILAFNGCLLLIYIFKKDFSSAKKVMLIGFIGLALGAYNLAGLISTLAGETGKQLSYFVSMSYGRAPIFSKIGFIALAAFLVYWYKQKSDKNAPLILAMVLSGWVALNQQIITGRMLQYGHYYWYFVVPLSIIAIFYMVWRLIENKNLKKILFIIIVAAVFINTAGGQYKSFFTSFDAKIYEQNFRSAINFLNSDRASGVILAGQDNGYLFTIYTPHDLFWHGAATLSYLPIQRIKDALFVYAFLNKQARNDFKNYFTEGGGGAERVFYQGLYRNLAGYYKYADKTADDNKILDRLSEEYNKAVENNGVDKLLEKYGVNYIVWDKNLNPEWDLSFLGDRIKEMVSFNNIYLYRLK